MSTAKRKSNIELLKIIAMIFITLSHCLPVYGRGVFQGVIYEQVALLDFNTLYVLFFRHLGQIGNILFVICSAWFLVDSDKVKINKVLHILLDTFIISVLSLTIGLLSGVEFTTIKMIKMLFPTSSALNWFVGCYLILYVVHGYLNTIIKYSNQKRLLGITAGMVILYLVICMILPDIFYYTNLMCFITVYFMVAYLKRYMPKFSCSKKKNIILFATMAVIYVGTILVYLIMATQFSFLKGRAIKLAVTNNIFMILMDIALFNIFKGINIKYSPIINKLSSVSLIFYLITENTVFAGQVRPYVFELIYTNYGYQFLSLWILLIVFVTFTLGMIVALIYKNTIGYLSSKVSDKVGAMLHRFFTRAYQVIASIR